MTWQIRSFRCRFGLSWSRSVPGIATRFWLSFRIRFFGRPRWSGSISFPDRCGVLRFWDPTELDGLCPVVVDGAHGRGSQGAPVGIEEAFRGRTVPTLPGSWWRRWRSGDKPTTASGGRGSRPHFRNSSIWFQLWVWRRSAGETVRSLVKCGMLPAVPGLLWLEVDQRVVDGRVGGPDGPFRNSTTQGSRPPW